MLGDIEPFGRTWRENSDVIPAIGKTIRNGGYIEKDQLLENWRTGELENWRTGFRRTNT